MNGMKALLGFGILVVIAFALGMFVMRATSEPTPPVDTSAWKEYMATDGGFSIKTPQGYTVNDRYMYQELGPESEIYGVAFKIPSSISDGTNLSSDSYISVEGLPNVDQCSATLFLEPQRYEVQTIADNGATYSFASTTGAAAGNRYEEWVWAIQGSNPCIAVRYFIHYGIIENYPQGQVLEFDHAALIREFDSIRKTLTVK